MHFITFQTCPHGPGYVPAEGDGRRVGGAGVSQGLKWPWSGFLGRWRGALQGEPFLAAPAQFPAPCRASPLCGRLFPTLGELAAGGRRSAPIPLVPNARARCTQCIREPAALFWKFGYRNPATSHQTCSPKRVAKDIFDQKDPLQLLKRCLEMDLLCHGTDPEHPTPAL